MCRLLRASVCVCVCVCVCLCVCLCVCEGMYVFVFLCVYVCARCLCACERVYFCMYVCDFVCVKILVPFCMYSHGWWFCECDLLVRACALSQFWYTVKIGNKS